MHNSRPRLDWVREMKRFGILLQDLDPASPLDVYAAERRYGESLCYKIVRPGEGEKHSPVPCLWE